MRSSTLASLLLLCLLPACSSVNRPLNSMNLPLEARISNHTRCETAALTDDADGLFVGIAISGGGLRSANFSAAVLLQLQKLRFLQHVDYISAVSGGSMTAAYYCSAPNLDWNPQALQQKLTHSYATDLATTIIQPWNTLALMTTNWNTSDILANTLDWHLYRDHGHSLTFADLRTDRPRLLINATDLQSGQRFVFCNESFDTLNSDLSRLNLAEAVAASGAFPILLHEKTLRDYSTSFAQYRHFIDGGVTDNLGIQSLIETYERQNTPAPGTAPLYPHGAVLVIIDAGNRYDAHLSDKENISFWERLGYHADLATTELLARANSATLSELLLLHTSPKFTGEDLRKQKLQLDEEGILLTKDRQERPIKVIHISLTRLHRLRDLPYPSFGESVQTISTFYNITQTEAYQLYQAADLLLKDPPAREALMQSLAQPQP
jgi:predicted acylesterase/phospholipase RssA